MSSSVLAKPSSKPTAANLFDPSKPTYEVLTFEFPHVSQMRRYLEVLHDLPPLKCKGFFVMTVVKMEDPDNPCSSITWCTQKKVTDGQIREVLDKARRAQELSGFGVEVLP